MKRKFAVVLSGFVFIFILFIHSVNALSNIRNDFKKAQVSDTVYAYENFIRSYPDDKKHLKKAIKRIDELDWEKAEKYGAALNYVDYLKKHPEGKYQKEAETLACEKSKSIGNIQLGYNFLLKMKKCESNAYLRKKIEDMEFKFSKRKKEPLYMDFL